MRAKMVADRLKAHESVAAALTQHGPKVSKQAEGLFTQYLKKGETLPDLSMFAVLLGRYLNDRATKMTEADDKHNAELADDQEPREERDAAAGDAYAAIVQLKGVVEPLFGAKWLKKLEFPNEVPRDPAILAALAQTLAANLQKTKLPKPIVAGVDSVQVGPWVKRLTETSKDLKKAIGDVTREAREAQATLVDKTREMKAYDDAFSLVVPVGAVLLRLVGEEELAAKLRPSVARPGTLETEEEVVVDAPEEEEKPT